MYDFANSGYTTVVLTAIYNTYFVGVVARANGADNGTATLLWTLAMGIANFLVLASAPVLGAIADHRACKKSFLLLTTVGCVLFTALLGLAGPGDIAAAFLLVVLASFMFGSGENLIASFLPEIARPDDMGRISGYGWTLGYIGGLLVLGVCLAWIAWAEGQGQRASQFVPVTLWITAGAFALAALPTFLWLRERTVSSPLPQGESYFHTGLMRVRHTLAEAQRFRDLFRFLITLAVYYCGINTVVVLAAVYAQQVMGFGTQETIVLILVVNFTAAAGAFLFGHLQDRFGSVRVLATTLLVWIAALMLAYFIESRAGFWVVANLIGVALGSSQSAGRALIGQFSPPARSAEFFGLWGLAGKLAAIVGPVSYGLITWLSHGNHRLALLATAVFFIAGLVLLLTVDEQRGRSAALAEG
ncbi:MAG: MFS transporter [Gammaproteobacteria bacterium]|nr:MFS transporter [Gammaproteobacteria bacterium]